MRQTSNKLRILVSSGILIVTVFLTVQIVSLAKQNQLERIDLSEVNHIRYGLLNVNEWSEKLGAILSTKIHEFQITPENQEQLQTSIENVLYTLINEVEVLMEERTSGQFSGLKKWVASLALDMEQLRDSVPSFATQVLVELEKPETKAGLTAFLESKLDEFSKATYNKDKMEPLEEVLRRYNCTDENECRQLLENILDRKKESINFRVIAIMVLVLGIFVINMIPRQQLNLVQSTLLILSSFCLLLGGIGTPMIELEARIDSLIFQLLGEEVAFTDNIIFFQSKSITDMVQILMKEGSLQMIFVGSLIFLFSIIFPLAKLASTYLYSLGRNKFTENMIIRFFVFKSGKWSMADVMVVAIFMAYIGFNGIIKSQLSSFSNATRPVEILTTNGTQLLGGFYLFVLFCISSLILSGFLTRKSAAT